MFKQLRRHLTPSTFIAFLALVLALTGGAFAAGGSGGSGAGSRATASTTLATAAKAKPKVKAGPRGPAGPAGKNGANGANGAAGPQGPQGAPGAKGENGAPGGPGEKGTNGANGKSVISATLQKGNSHCPEGGSEFEVEGSSAPPTFACNGGAGSGGEGYPKTLPSGETETGTWSVTEKPSLKVGERVEATTSISLPIPLPEPAVRGKAAKIEYVKVSLSSKLEPEPTGNANCPGFNKTPQAAKGFLCIYSIAAFERNVSSEAGHEVKYRNPEAELAGFTEKFASRTGATLLLESGEATSEGREELHAEGAWAVTAE